jgi:hypothetical protein
VDVSDCTGVSAEALRRQATIELGAPLADEATPDVTRVTATCDQGLVVLTVDDPLTGKTLSRRLELDIDPPSARVRLLALAAVELVVASWIELEATTPLSRPIDAVAPQTARDDAVAILRRTHRVAPPPDWALFLLGTVRFGSSPVMFGGAVGARRRLPAPWILAIDVMVERGNERASFGDVDVTLASAATRFGAAFNLWGLELEASGGARLGAAHVRGTASADTPVPVEGKSFTALWGGPMVTFAARAGGENAAIGLGTEIGWAAFGVEGQVAGTAEARLSGPWVAVSLALQTSFR